MTICIRCRYSKGPNPHLGEYYCSHPTVKRESELNCVTGAPVYITYSLLGKTRWENEFPECWTINKGNCHLYEEKLNGTKM